MWQAVQIFSVHLVMLPFYIIGCIMHLQMVAYEVVRPFMAWLMLPKHIREGLTTKQGVVAVSLAELQEFQDEYMKTNPDATPDDVMQAMYEKKLKEQQK